MPSVHIGDIVTVRFREGMRVLKVVGMSGQQGFHFEGILAAKPPSDRCPIGARLWVRPGEVVQVASPKAGRKT